MPCRYAFVSRVTVNVMYCGSASKMWMCWKFHILKNAASHNQCCSTLRFQTIVNFIAAIVSSLAILNLTWSQRHPLNIRQDKASSATVHSRKLDTCTLAWPNMHVYAVLCTVSIGRLLASLWAEYFLFEAYIWDATIPPSCCWKADSYWCHCSSISQVSLECILGPSTYAQNWVNVTAYLPF